MKKRGRPQTPEAEKRSYPVRVNFTQSEFDALTKRAWANDVGISTHIYNIIKKYLYL